jgi:poly(A) polymerase
LGKKPKDFDIVTSASPARIKRVFRNARIIGRRFRLVHVFFGPKIFEVSTFRSMKDGPTSNTFGTIEEDVLRRDFTLNALFYDPLKQLVVDYVGGMKDIRNSVIRSTIAMQHIFTDDPVRMIRAVKYGAATGFRLPFSLKWMIRRQSGLLASVSASRLTEEIFKIIHSPNARKIVEDLDAMGLYSYLQPNAAELFKGKAGFRNRYLASMGSLNCEGFKNLPGEALSALVRDYINDCVDWGSANEGSREGKDSAPLPGAPGSSQMLYTSGAEWPPMYPSYRAQPEGLYRNAFALARKFVLPMNPPQTELYDALKLLFAEHGISVKRTRAPGRPKRLRKPAETGSAAVQESGRIAAVPEKTARPGRSSRAEQRVRRRKPKDSTPAPKQ